MSVRPFVETEYIAQLELGELRMDAALFRDSGLRPTIKQKAGGKCAGLLRLK